MSQNDPKPFLIFYASCGTTLTCLGIGWFPLSTMKRMKETAGLIRTDADTITSTTA